MIGWLRQALRQLRDERVSTFGLVGLVLVTSFVAAAAPRVFERVSDDALRRDIAAASASTRSLQLVQTARIDAAPGEDPLRVAEATGASLERQIPPEIEALVTGRSLVVQTARWRITSPTKMASEFLLRFQDGVQDRIRVTAGRLPTGHTETVEDPSSFVGLPGGKPIAFEGMISDTAAEIMGLGVGDRVALTLDSSDPLAGRRVGQAAIDIVGTYAVIDPTAPFWFDDTTVVRPRTRALSADVEYLDAPVFLSPDAYRALLSSTQFSKLPFRYAWRYEVDPVRLAASRADALVTALRRMESVFPTVGAATSVQHGTSLQGGLLGLLAAYAARWRSALAVLSVVAIGPIVAAALAIGMAAVQIGRRRRPALTILRRRGASTVQLIGGTLAQGILLAVPAALLGAGLAVVAFRDGSIQASLIAAALVAAGTLALFVGAIAPAVRSPLRDSSRDTLTARRASPRRLVTEGIVVAMAVLGVVLLRQRGVLGGSSAGELPSADPFIAAVPVLVGVAAGLLVIRLLPIPMVGLARVAAWRRDLVPVLALRRVTRSGGGIPILIVLLAVASFGAFASATIVHLDRAAEAVGWQEVGAPFRVTTPAARLPSDLDGASLPGVEAAAPAFQSGITLGTTPVQLLAPDLAAYREVVRDTPAAAAVRPEIVGPPGSSIPAIVSTGLVQGSNAVTVGEPFELVVDGHRASYRAVAVADVFPTLPVGSQFIVVDRAQLQATRPDDPLPTTSMLIRAQGDDAAALRQALSTAAPGALLVGRAERTAEVRAAPVVVAAVIGVRVAAILNALYATLALTAALALTGAGQADEVAHLRTLGLSRREASALMVVEHGPVVAAAIGTGLVLGIGLFMRPGLGLAAIVGSAVVVPLAVAPAQLVLVVAAIGAIVVVGVAIGTALQRRADVVAAIRRGLE